ncbi:MAG: hypothetical protein ACXWB4_04745, partial [Kaistella sp.]
CLYEHRSAKILFAALSQKRRKKTGICTEGISIKKFHNCELNLRNIIIIQEYIFSEIFKYILSLNAEMQSTAGISFRL